MKLESESSWTWLHAGASQPSRPLPLSDQKMSRATTRYDPKYAALDAMA